MFGFLLGFKDGVTPASPFVPFLTQGWIFLVSKNGAFGFRVWSQDLRIVRSWEWRRWKAREVWHKIASKTVPVR